MFKKKNNSESAENSTLQNEEQVAAAPESTAEEKKEEAISVFKTSMDDDEHRKGVYIDKAEAEAFLEAQRKKKQRKKIITTVVCTVLALLFVFIVYKVIFGGNVGFIKYSDDYIKELDAKTVGESIPSDSGLVLISEKPNGNGGTTKLEFSPKDTLIILTVSNKEGDTSVFRSWPAPNETEMDPATAEDSYPRYKVNHDIVSSLVRLGYTASNLDGGKDFGINQVSNVKAEYNKIEGGFRVRYTVPISVTKTDSMADTHTEYYEFSFVVEFYLDDQGNLIANVPKKEIVEDKKEEEYTDKSDEMPRVASISCLPFLDCARQGDEGYFVTPDGSGGLTYFDVARISQYDEYSKRVYGYDDIFDIFNYPNQTNETVVMPVYGVVKGNTALTVYATEGEANAAIVMGQPGMKNLNFYYINFMFRWREFYQSKISKSGSAYTFLEVPSGIGDFRQVYTFQVAHDEEYDYVDVAENARTFLLNKWQEDGKELDYLQGAKINSPENKNQDPDVLNLKIFFTDVNKASVRAFASFKVMTTFAQAEDIIKDSQAACPKIRYSLLGWQQDGYYGNITRKFNIEKALGGKSGLKKLNSQADIAADMNMLLLYGKPKGASLRRAVVKDAGTNYINYKIVSNAGVFQRNDNYYYMSPLYYDAKLLKNDVKGLEKLGFKSVDLQQLGNLLFTDYNKENALLRQQALEYYRKWIVEYQKAFDTVSVYYGYEYAASVADNILDIPTESSSLFIVDESVPFVEIVYHGVVDYYSKAINRTSDNTKALLKSIEYGAFFTYEVTNETTEDLRYTNYNALFKAQYSSLSDDIKKAYVLAEKLLVPVENATIVGHYCVDTKEISHEKAGLVFCTEYSNGVKIYVNYGKTDYTVAGGTVPALGAAIDNSGFTAVKVG